MVGAEVMCSTCGLQDWAKIDMRPYELVQRALEKKKREEGLFEHRARSDTHL